MIGAAAACAAIVIQLHGNSFYDYQRQRVLTLLDPEADALGTAGTLFSPNSNRFWWVLRERFPRRYSITFALLTRRPY